MVPKTGKGEWLGSYEELSDFVVSVRHDSRATVASASILTAREGMVIVTCRGGDTVLSLRLQHVEVV